MLRWALGKSPPSLQVVDMWINLFPFSPALVSWICLSWWQRAKPCFQLQVNNSYFRLLLFFLFKSSHLINNTSTNFFKCLFHLPYCKVRCIKVKYFLPLYLSLSECHFYSTLFLLFTRYKEANLIWTFKWWTDKCEKSCTRLVLYRTLHEFVNLAIISVMEVRWGVISLLSIKHELSH